MYLGLNHINNIHHIIYNRLRLTFAPLRKENINTKNENVWLIT